MNTTSFSTEKQEQYKQSKQKLLDFLSTLEEPLSHAATLLDMPRQDSVAAITDKLQKDIFSLVLIGAFQSGKSTLFNYLCDGRELSPVGPGGGGIRTSGCRVTAHSVAEGEEEYALVSWRTPDELLRSLGKSLLPYYGKERGTSGADYLTEKLVNLHDAEQRALLEQRAWEQLENPKHSAEDKELLRFTLLVCRFFPQFAERSQSAESRVSVQEVTRLTAYPQKWKSLWLQAHESKDLSAFEGMVSFAFVAGVDLYLNSPILRELGCSVTDCPGLFISKWDTMIAERCIREANALLYMFGGAKALTQEDKQALQTCVELGGQYKMLFGANLRIAAQQWQRIEENDVQPDLKELGFDSPVIHPFHSGLALRARERFLQEYKLLDTASCQGVDLDISLDNRFSASGDADADRSRYLEKVLNRFIFNLTNGEESLADYKVQDVQALEALSRVPDFIKSAKDFVVEHRAPSLLVNQGIDVILGELRNNVDTLNKKREWLDTDTENAHKRVQDAHQELEGLEKDHKQALHNIGNAIEVHRLGVLKHFDEVLTKAYDSREERIKILFTECRPSVYRQLICGYDANARCQKFADGLYNIFKECLSEVKTNIKQEFAGLDDFVAIRTTFEHERGRLLRTIRALKDIPPLSVMEVKLPKNWEDSAAKMPIPPMDEIWGKLTQNKTTWVAAFLDFLNFGFLEPFISEKHMANEFAKRHRPAFLESFKISMNSALSKPEAPFGIIEQSATQFSQAFERPIDHAKQFLLQAEKECEEKDAPARQALVKILSETAKQAEKYVQTAEGIKKELQKYF